ncbi:MAG: hypothetical protein H6910_05515 [Rickettsiaceae bacterium]|nr:hypothetical protein [Rickettsiaceae bacterium]MCP5378559.1 hypothetical protein [Rickettsiaceae bacterium]
MTDAIILRPDAKGRITLGEITNNVSSYRVTVEDNGTITLEPYAEIPLAEKWIFENKELLEKVVQQIKAEQTK